MSDDNKYMLLAIEQAELGKGKVSPNPLVGCVIVKNDKVIATGYHKEFGGPHAEVDAISKIDGNLKGCTVYVTLEPCSHTGKTPPCADALIDAGVKKVIVAMKDPNPLVAGSGLKKLHDAGIETEDGLLEAQARELNLGFIKRMETGRPFVRIKLAMSLDGRTAMASGESQWISGEASRDDVQRLRAESSAILTGIDTVLADNPSMNVRLTADRFISGSDDEVRQPKRIVLDSQFKMPSGAKISSIGGECIVYTTVNADNKSSYPFIIETCDAQDGRIDLQFLMKDLAKKEINLLHVEAGSVLCGALLKNDLVDEIIIYMAPHIMGNDAKGLFHLPELVHMKDRISLTIKDVRSVGNDIRITAQPERC